MFKNFQLRFASEWVEQETTEGTICEAVFGGLSTRLKACGVCTLIF